MDLLRIESKDVGPIYIDARLPLVLAKKGDDTNVGIALPHGGVDLTVAGDVDEVAQAIERAFPDAHIWSVASAA